MVEESLHRGVVTGGMTGGAVKPDSPQPASEPLVAHGFLNTRTTTSVPFSHLESFTSPPRQPLRRASSCQLPPVQFTMYPTRVLRMQASRPFFYPTPKENQSAHTISQRLRTLKKIPPELIPLGIVLSVAVSAAIYSGTKKLLTDKTLRLSRSRPEDRQ